MEVRLGDGTADSLGTIVGDNGDPGIATIEFTADNATQTFSFTAIDGSRASLNGVAVTQLVPEPGSMALLGLGTLALLRRR